MDEQFFENIRRLIELEKENVRINWALLQEMMERGVQEIRQLDRVADRLLDSMLGLTCAGEEEYHHFLDYMATFNPTEAKERRDDLEYDMGYKTHVLYAAAILCKRELEPFTSPDGRASFKVVMDDYIPQVYNVMKQTASFLFFAHYANGRSVPDMMQMLKTITEETDYVLKHVDEFEDLMHYPKEIYHPLREDEWQLIQFIAEQNIQLYDEGRVINKNLLNDVFVR